MNVVARRGPVLVLWILLALLPLRGWANAWMHPTTAPQTVVQAASMPCHDEPAGADSAADLTGAGDCHLCDLCHGLGLPTMVEPLQGDGPRPVWQRADGPTRLAALPSPFDRPPRA